MLFSPHVHFPSTPGLASTEDTYSPGTYCRDPIEVAPNSCAMPERGGRVYSPTDVLSPRPRPINSYFHPRAFEACEPLDGTAVPDLLHDMETDESTEECVSPKSLSPEPHVAVRIHGKPMPIRCTRSQSQEEFNHALSFLPHPPVPVPKRALEKRRNSPHPHRPRRSVAFKEPIADCDGCLGGF